MRELPILIVRRHGSNDIYADSRVCRQWILSAIQWLQRQNPCYSGISINNTYLQCLPENGLPEGLLNVDKTDVFSSPEEGVDAEYESSSFLPLQEKKRLGHLFMALSQSAGQD